ncbi:MAG: ABC transporter permease [Roseovarius sp.]|nr:ABC transporter permease [Roseovarius sp.]MCY4208434.1 ABC transporter permease [Roseovarius sp.]MCY4290816.1 ABC transporter permease [Roseovarius sp.]MCY4316236.1 ABC transporter permease [Roseovarius sp.]
MGRIDAIRIASGMGAIVAWILIWAWLTRPGGPVPTLYFPAPDDVWTKFVRMWVRPYIGSTLIEHILSSLYIVLFGWTVAAVVGIPLGIAMAWWTKLKWIVFPIFQLIRPVPPLAWIPLTILWLGIGDTARMSVVFIAALVPWLMNSMLAVYSVDKLLIDAGKALGASDRQILMRIVCRTALPTLVAGARMALGSAWSTLVAAEILAATAGLGYVAVNASQLLDTDVLLVAMFLIGILGISLTALITIAQRFLAPWSFADVRGTNR